MAQTVVDLSASCPTLPDGRGNPAPQGCYAWLDHRRRSLLPGVQCDVCKHIGHEVFNYNILALALFVNRYVRDSLVDSDCTDIEHKWLTRWKEHLGEPGRTPQQVMWVYCDTMNTTPDTLDWQWTGTAGWEPMALTPNY
jgi:hypothetical protein